MTQPSILDEPRLSLTSAAKRANVNVATVWRWALRGARGRMLKTILVGGRRFVLVRDLEDFISGEGEEPAAKQPALSARAMAAGEELDRLGL